MLKWKAFVALSVLVGMLSAVHAQQRGTNTGSTLTALDYFEIQQLYARFCHGLDSAADDGFMFANVFTPDGVYVDPSGMSFTGRERLAALARQNPDGKKGPTNVAHYTTNIMITPATGGATGRGYLLLGAPAPQRGAAPAAGAAAPAGGGAQAGRAAAPAAGVAQAGGAARGGVTDAGMYQDDLVKTADGWRIKKRVFVRASR